MTADAFPEFAWAVGEESSDPLVLRRGEVHRVDELALSRHLERQDADLGDVARLGIRVVRYGMPWRLTEPEPGRYDWSLWDAALTACERHGLEPIVDLCHFGQPDHLPGFCEPPWVDAFLRYVDAFLARYPEPRWFTPVNEPHTTALLSGRLGVWNDRRADVADQVLALSLCALADVEAHARVVADRGGWSIGAEAVAVPIGPAGEADVHDDGQGDGHPDGERRARRLALDRATWDLRLGQPLDERARAAFVAVPDELLERVASLATTEHVVAGHDLYPVSFLPVEGDQLDAHPIAERLDAYVRWATSWYERYRTPFWVAETSNLGLPTGMQGTWLDGLVERLATMRGRGLPVRGLCWYSRGDQFDWQTALVEPTAAVTEVGLFDQARVARPVASRLAELARAGTPGADA